MMAISCRLEFANMYLCLGTLCRVFQLHTDRCCRLRLRWIVGKRSICQSCFDKSDNTCGLLKWLLSYSSHVTIRWWRLQWNVKTAKLEQPLPYEGLSQRNRYDACRARRARFKLDHMARLEHDYERNETNPCGKSDAWLWNQIDFIKHSCIRNIEVFIFCICRTSREKLDMLNRERKIVTKDGESRRMFNEL